MAYTGWQDATLSRELQAAIAEMPCPCSRGVRDGSLGNKHCNAAAADSQSTSAVWQPSGSLHWGQNGQSACCKQQSNLPAHPFGPSCISSMTSSRLTRSRTSKLTGYLNSSAAGSAPANGAGGLRTRAHQPLGSPLSSARPVVGQFCAACWPADRQSPCKLMMAHQG